MEIKDLKHGQIVKRTSEAYHQNNLTIRKIWDRLFYYRGNTKVSLVTSDSSAYLNDDFYLCDKHGVRLTEPKEIKPKEPTMAYNDDFIVTDNKTNQVKGFKEEDDALEYMEDVLEVHPRARFKMYKAVAETKRKTSKIKKMLNFFTS